MLSIFHNSFEFVSNEAPNIGKYCTLGSDVAQYCWPVNLVTDTKFSIVARTLRVLTVYALK